VVREVSQEVTELAHKSERSDAVLGYVIEITKAAFQFFWEQAPA
jgi:hypothetical protein